MKLKNVALGLAISSTLLFTQCDVLNEVASEVVNTTTSSTSESGSSLTNSEVIAGLKEALTVGIKNSVSVASVTNGYLDNANIKLPFPEDAVKLKEKAEEWGLDGQVTKIVETLNHAAEGAATEAKPIFVNAITSMSVSDGFAILNGSDSAATTYLKEKTYSSLVTAYEPKVQSAIDSVKLTSYWEPVATKYNKFATLTGKEEVNSDLTNYVTTKGLDGLFYLVKQEEKDIRENPTARVTDLLEKVFGSLGN